MSKNNILLQKKLLAKKRKKKEAVFFHHLIVRVSYKADVIWLDLLTQTVRNRTYVFFSHKGAVGQLLFYMLFQYLQIQCCVCGHVCVCV